MRNLNLFFTLALITSVSGVYAMESYMEDKIVYISSSDSESDSDSESEQPARVYSLLDLKFLAANAKNEAKYLAKMVARGDSNASMRVCENFIAINDLGNCFENNVIAEEILANFNEEIQNVLLCAKCNLEQLKI